MHISTNGIFYYGTGDVVYYKGEKHKVLSTYSLQVWSKQHLQMVPLVGECRDYRIVPAKFVKPVIRKKSDIKELKLRLD